VLKVTFEENTEAKMVEGKPCMEDVAVRNHLMYLWAL
jgi:hypothetical protein